MSGAVYFAILIYDELSRPSFVSVLIKEIIIECSDAHPTNFTMELIC